MDGRQQREGSSPAASAPPTPKTAIDRHSRSLRRGGLWDGAVARAPDPRHSLATTPLNSGVADRERDPTRPAPHGPSAVPLVRMHPAEVRACRLLDSKAPIALKLRSPTTPSRGRRSAKRVDPRRTRPPPRSWLTGTRLSLKLSSSGTYGHDPSRTRTDSPASSAAFSRDNLAVPQNAGCFID